MTEHHQFPVYEQRPLNMFEAPSLIENIPSETNFSKIKSITNNINNMKSFSDKFFDTEDMYVGHQLPEFADYLSEVRASIGGYANKCNHLQGKSNTLKRANAWLGERNRQLEEHDSAVMENCYILHHRLQAIQEKYMLFKHEFSNIHAGLDAGNANDADK